MSTDDQPPPLLPFPSTEALKNAPQTRRTNVNTTPKLPTKLRTDNDTKAGMQENLDSVGIDTCYFGNSRQDQGMIFLSSGGIVPQIVK